MIIIETLISEEKLRIKEEVNRIIKNEKLFKKEWAIEHFVKLCNKKTQEGSVFYIIESNVVKEILEATQFCEYNPLLKFIREEKNEEDLIFSLIKKIPFLTNNNNNNYLFKIYDNKFLSKEESILATHKLRHLSIGFKIVVKFEKEEINYNNIIQKIDEHILEKELSKAVESKYFSSGSKIDILKKLKIVFHTAKFTIKIYDNYINVELLKLLSNVNKNVKIKILTSDESNKKKFSNQINSFQNLYEINIKLKISNNSHDRFYIIDKKVFTLGTSTKGGGVNKATIFSKINDEEGKKIKKDYNKWWKEADN